MVLLANWRNLPPSSLYSLPLAAHLAMVPSLMVEAQAARGQGRHRARVQATVAPQSIEAHAGSNHGWPATRAQHQRYFDRIPLCCRWQQAAGEQLAKCTGCRLPPPPLTNSLPKQAWRMFRRPPNPSTRLIAALFVPQGRCGMKHVLPCSQPITCVAPAAKRAAAHGSAVSNSPQAARHPRRC